MSGAEEAWIADEIGEEKVGHVFIRGAQISQVGNMLGATLANVRQKSSCRYKGAHVKIPI